MKNVFSLESYCLCDMTNKDGDFKDAVSVYQLFHNFSFQAETETEAASWIVSIETAIQKGLGDQTVRSL